MRDTMYARENYLGSQSVVTGLRVVVLRCVVQPAQYLILHDSAH